MKNVNFTKIFNTIKRTVDKKSPEILIGLGIAGMVTTVALAVKATPKAMKCIEEENAKQNKESDQTVELKKKDIVKATWKCYIPAAISGAASIGCILGANSVHSKRNAAIATAYRLSEKAFSDYRGAVLSEVGEEKAKIIKDKVAQKHLDENPVSSNQVIVTGTGRQLCYDGISGRYFESSIPAIDAAVNKINRTLNFDMYASLSEFYDELDLEHTSVSDDLGWNIDDGLVAIDYGSRISDDGRPCITLEYYVAPRYDFSKLM